MAEEGENVVYVGNKPVLSYVLAVITQFNNGSEEVVLKARGRAISRAVDVAEVVRNKFLPNVTVAGIKTGVETVESPDGRMRNVSTIEIRLKL
ncbi:MAG: DNA/RNA-binding protein AlbA/Ssh10b [Candidatus Alkanophagales archaeon MCA70_species_1]|nr:DNA/RNA-binding protein AlbA/Ssh10b [Candidatus Alkanophaga volatiphilum]